MLIVNNTLPKCGGVWIYSMISRMLAYRRPDEKWRQPGWGSVSPAEDRLEEYLAEENWFDDNVLFKAHYGVASIRPLDKPGIRVIVGVRDAADAALSRHHHLKRQGRAGDRDEWLATEGLVFANALGKLEKAWARIAHIVRYEDLLADPVPHILGMMAFLEGDQCPDKAAWIARDTAADKMKGSIGDHIRRASSGGAREELPPEIYSLLAKA